MVRNTFSQKIARLLLILGLLAFGVMLFETFWLAVKSKHAQKQMSKEIHKVEEEKRRSLDAISTSTKTLHVKNPLGGNVLTNDKAKLAISSKVLQSSEDLVNDTRSRGSNRKSIIVEENIKENAKQRMSENLETGLMNKTLKENTVTVTSEKKTNNPTNYKKKNPVIHIKDHKSCPNLPVVLPSISEQQLWLPVTNKSVDSANYIFSAYLDVRGNFAKVCVMAYQSSEPNRLYCQLWYQNKTTGKPYNQVVHTTTDYIYRLCGGKRYLQVKWTCEIEPEVIPYAVSVTESPCAVPVTSLPIIDARVPDNLPESYAVCIKPMHRGYNRTRQLVEFIELSRMFGATHFTLYDYLGNLTVLNPVIREYEKQGLLELVNWKLAGMVTDHVLNPEEERFVKGFEDQCTQVLAHTECLYRNLHKYKYIAFYDLDEMLVPGYNRTWPELVKLIPKNYSSFIFHNRFFPLRNRVKEELGKYNDPLLIKYHPVSLEYTLAESEIVFTRPKVMVLGKGVSKCRVHHVVHLSGSHPFDIPVHLGTMWHYRSRPPKDSKKPAERDYYMYKFKDELLARMDRIFQKTRALIV